MLHRAAGNEAVDCSSGACQADRTPPPAEGQDAELEPDGDGERPTIPTIAVHEQRAIAAYAVAMRVRRVLTVMGLLGRRYAGSRP